MTDLEWKIADAAVRGLIIGGTLSIIIGTYHLIKKFIKKRISRENQFNSVADKLEVLNARSDKQHCNSNSAGGISGFKLLIIITFVAIASALSAININKISNSPKNYDECILQNIKGTTEEYAAKLIRKSCRNKFPIQKKIHTDNSLKKHDVNSSKSRESNSYLDDYDPTIDYTKKNTK